jgi:uncharacterized protein (TIGR03067 family)
LGEYPLREAAISDPWMPVVEFIMRTVVFLALGLALSVGAVLAVTGDDPIENERKIYQGTWKVVAMEVDGKEVAAENASKLTVINKADGSWSVESEGKEISSGKSDIDPTKKPKTIDFMGTLGVFSGKEYLGIYELDKDTRQICFAEKANGRPAEFAAPAGSGRWLIKFERAKKK